MIHDIRFALRTLRRWPSGVVAILATLGIAIGVTTAVFSIIDTVLLRPVSIPAPDRVVAIYTPRPVTRYGSSTYRTYRELAARNSTLAGVTAVYRTLLPLRIGEDVEDLAVAFVTDEYFEVLGVPTALGRPIVSGAPASAGADPVIVLSAQLWRRLFGADPSVLGRRIQLDGRPLTVIGVTDDRFRGTNLSAVPDAWVPASMIPAFGIDMLSRAGSINEGIPIFGLVARLAPGATVGAAAAEVAGIIEQVGGSSFGDATVGSAAASVLPIAEAAIPPEERTAMLRFVGLLFAVVVLMTILASLNIANLLVVRASERAKELGVRTVLGAGRARLARQLLTESLILALAGGGIGLGLARVTLDVLSKFTLPGRIALDRVALGLDTRVLAFTSVMTVLTAVGFGVAPALRAGRVRVVELLGAGAPLARRRRGALLTLQVALSLALLVGAALFLRSVRAGLNADVGFDPRPLAALSVQPVQEGTREEDVERYAAVLSELEHAPGVIAAAASSHVPLAPVSESEFGRGPAEPDSTAGSVGKVSLGLAHIQGDYFGTMGIPVIEGRSFTTQDDAPGAESSIILSQAAARALWPGEPAVGKRVHGRFWITNIWFTYTVVGVVADIRYTDPGEHSRPFAYVPLAHQDLAGGSVSFVVRARDAAAALPILQRTVGDVAPALKPARLDHLRPRLVSGQIEMRLAPQRFSATLLSLFAILALCVAGVGIHATVTYAVSLRTREIGIRMALGAGAPEVLWAVLFDTGVAVAAGIALGTLAALVGAMLARRLLYDVAPFDPVSFVVAILVIVAMAAVAAVVPARRAVLMDPAAATRVM